MSDKVSRVRAAESAVDSQREPRRSHPRGRARAAKRLRSYLLGALSPLYAGAARATLSLLNLAASGRGGYEHRNDIAYGPLPHQRLDLYLPKDGDDGERLRPLLLFFHGGRWSDGSKDDYRFVGEAFSSRGIATAIAGYALYPQVRFPVFVQDAARAVVWAAHHCEDFGAEGPLFVAGHSSGAHIASLLALDPSYLEEAGGTGVKIAGMLGLAGPYDFLPLRDADLIDIFGPVERHGESQPIRYVSPTAPPALLLHGEADSTVGPRNSRKLAEKLSAAGVPVTLRLYPGLTHLRILGALASPLRFIAPVLDDIERFIEKNGNGVE